MEMHDYWLMLIHKSLASLHSRLDAVERTLRTTTAITVPLRALPLGPDEPYDWIDAHQAERWRRVRAFGGEHPVVGVSADFVQAKATRHSTDE